MSHVARSVYGLDVGVAEYGGAVADMQMLYRIIEPAGSLKTDVIGKLEGLVSDYSLLASLAHPVTNKQPLRAGNMGHITWKNPFTEAVSRESFPEVFDRALEDYAGFFLHLTGVFTKCDKINLSTFCHIERVGS